jgi:hypothetical protein
MKAPWIKARPGVRVGLAALSALAAGHTGHAADLEFVRIGAASLEYLQSACPGLELTEAGDIILTASLRKLERHGLAVPRDGAPSELLAIIATDVNFPRYLQSNRERCAYATMFATMLGRDYHLGNLTKTRVGQDDPLTYGDLIPMMHRRLANERIVGIWSDSRSIFARLVAISERRGAYFLTELSERGKFIPDHAPLSRVDPMDHASLQFERVKNGERLTYALMSDGTLQGFTGAGSATWLHTERIDAEPAVSTGDGPAENLARP